MSLTKSSNPIFGKNVFSKAYSYDGTTDSMTVSGTMNKTFVLLLLMLVSAVYVWSKFFEVFSIENPVMPSFVSVYMMIGAIGGLIMAIVISFMPRHAGVLSPIYALLEGLFLGGISAYFEARFSGIVIRAISLTFGVFLGMLLIYRGGIIKVTDGFRRGVVAATLGVAVVYLAAWIFGMFGVNTSFLFGGGTFGIVISLVVITIAAMNLLLDFDFIEKASASGAPKYMEWFGAFGLMVTLVWLYIEILRLLSRLGSRS